MQNNFKVIGIDNLSNSFSLKIIHPNFLFIKADIAQKKIINDIFLISTPRIVSGCRGSVSDQFQTIPN